MKLLFLSGLKGRMLLSICSTVFIGLAAITGIVTYQAENLARTDAILLAQGRARLVGNEANAELETAMSAARTVGDALAGLTQAGGTPSRAAANAILRQTLATNPQFTGVWTVWEANAFDGHDADFANQAGHDATGRLVPYWGRHGAELAVEPSKDYTADGAGDYCRLSKALNRESVIEPHLAGASGREDLMTSVSVPIHNAAGAVVGVAGVDVPLASLSAALAHVKVGEKAYAAIVSNAGRYVAHPTAKRVGQPMMATDPWVQPFLESIRKGEDFTAQNFSHTLNDQVFRLGAPIVIGQTGTPWAAVVSIPEGEVLAAAHRLRNLVLGVGGAVLAAVLAVVVVLAGRITRPIHRMAETLGAGADQVAAASAQVATASQSLAQGASEQAASLEETGASSEEMAAMTKRNAGHAEDAKTLAGETRAAADAGTADMRELSTAMTELQAASASVAKIVKTIDEIAFQTNILALNAAVEAARAGEAGMGFGVVAEEVRSLAQRSAGAAKETAATIEMTIQRSERGFALSSKVANGLDEIVGKVRRVDELVGQIATASNEQNQGITQINSAMSQMDRITQQSAASAEETASASEELSAQAVTLKAAVAELVALVDGQAAHRRAAEVETDVLPPARATGPLVRPTLKSRPSGDRQVPERTRRA